jgi:hypothetical protein
MRSNTCCLTTEYSIAEQQMHTLSVAQTGMLVFSHPDYTVGPGTSPDHAS